MTQFTSNSSLRTNLINEFFKCYDSRNNTKVPVFRAGVPGAGNASNVRFFDRNSCFPLFLYLARFSYARSPFSPRQFAILYCANSQSNSSLSFLGLREFFAINELWQPMQIMVRLFQSRIIYQLILIFWCHVCFNNLLFSKHILGSAKLEGNALFPPDLDRSIILILQLCTSFWERENRVVKIT